MRRCLSKFFPGNGPAQAEWRLMSSCNSEQFLCGGSFSFVSFRRSAVLAEFHDYVAVDSASSQVKGLGCFRGGSLRDGDFIWKISNFLRLTSSSNLWKVKLFN